MLLSGKFGQLGFCLGETVRQKTPLPLGHSQLRPRISQALFVLDMPLLQCLMDLFQLGELPCQLLLCAAAEDQRLLGRVQGALQSIVVLRPALFLCVQFAQVGLLCEQALAELCQLLFQVLLALFRGLALVGALLRDRCLVMLELPLRLLQVLAQWAISATRSTRRCSSPSFSLPRLTKVISCRCTVSSSTWLRAWAVASA